MTGGFMACAATYTPGKMGSRQGGDFFLGERSERRTAPVSPLLEEAPSVDSTAVSSPQLPH